MATGIGHLTCKCQLVGSTHSFQHVGGAVVSRPRHSQEQVGDVDIGGRGGHVENTIARADGDWDCDILALTGRSHGGQYQDQSRLQHGCVVCMCTG